ncbi:AAA family ATPase [Bradyrhizobium sp. 38]|uniref:AAA family ATPase n=1 Tax=unclassified Bradyrhizobium TaxID=2631580 RepID=UPI001FFAE891|nr:MULTISPECIES: AAA family ATPase [unclassified Bradyrhizobium]MCK1336843.1 AAA family ATPase [Bradyrhizobium sp. 38]MCK1776863.1 AAA family ATPase [Bradyrhizobium sp. 132]
MMHACSEPTIGEERGQALLDAVTDRSEMRSQIRSVVNVLYATGTPAGGAMALAWSMLMCDPRKPSTFFSVLPQLQHELDEADLPGEVEDNLRLRLRVWWRAAEGGFTTSSHSVFRLADPEGECWPEPEVTTRVEIDMEKVERRAPAGPTLVVMPKHRSSKLNNYNLHYKDIVDAALPLIVVRDVHAIRTALYLEFPHATAAVNALTRDLRDGKPAHVKPACLVGSAGSGKSRLVRKLAALISLHVHRFDGATSDGQFSGTAKGWSNTEPSVPTRAVRQSMTANPVVMIDEIDKATSSTNGYLPHALLSFTDPETALRYRDQSLDAELNLSVVSYIATANDAKLLPGMLRDRFRMIRMPEPELRHLPQLAANVMRDLAAEDDARVGDTPLAGDELAVMGKAWAKAGFSMRKLKAIVLATLEARDQCQMRH